MANYVMDIEVEWTVDKIQGPGWAWKRMGRSELERQGKVRS